jgi:hypothetical protein
MINLYQVEKEIIQDIRPNLVLNYLIINEINIIPKEVSLNIISIIFEMSENIIVLKQDKNIIKFSEIYFLKLMASMMSDNIDFIKYGVSSLIDDTTNLVLLNSMNSILGNPTITIDHDNLIVDDFSDDLKIMMINKFAKYKIKYSDIIDRSIKILTNELKTDKKFLKSVL